MELTDRKGVAAVQSIFLNEFEWMFREQHESDYGIDAQVEVVERSGQASGKLIALQIKSGSSYFKSRKGTSGVSYTYYGKLRHLDYWLQHSLPVFLIIHHPVKNATFWQRLEARLVRRNSKGWSIDIPKTNILDKAAKRYFEAGTSNDPEGRRRFHFATDKSLMQDIADQENTLFVFDEWINKSLNIRGIKVYHQEYDSDGYLGEPDFVIDLWAAHSSPNNVMREAFPWLDYDYAGPIREHSGEIASHVFDVRLTAEAHYFLDLERFYRDGAANKPEPVPPRSEDELSDEEMWDELYQHQIDDEHT